MDGVKVYVVTPDVIPSEHRDKLLIHVHGGCYVLFPGESGTTEAIMMAGLGHFKVISVDYRMPPEGYFPAALENAMTVYKAALKKANPKNMAVFGSRDDAGSKAGAASTARRHSPWYPDVGRHEDGRMRWSTMSWCPGMDSATPRQLSTRTAMISRIRYSRPSTEICTASRLRS
jgi:hypothetical protein